MKRSLCRAALLLLAFPTGCAAVEPSPLRSAPPARAASRPPEAEAAWLSRFWSELTPAQRARVRTGVRRVDPSLSRNDREAARFWDGLGARERRNLLSGSGTLPRPALPGPPPVPPEQDGQ